jgi:hypothetical protein
MTLATFGTGEVLWSILWFFLFMMWIFLAISVIADVFASRDLSGGAKAMWAVFVIFLPYLGIFIYLIARGDKMADHSFRAAQAQEEAARAYIQDAAGSASVADELSKLADLKAAGTLDDAEYASAKAKLLGS